MRWFQGPQGSFQAVAPGGDILRVYCVGQLWRGTVAARGYASAAVLEQTAEAARRATEAEWRRLQRYAAAR